MSNTKEELNKQSVFFKPVFDSKIILKSQEFDHGLGVNVPKIRDNL